MTFKDWLKPKPIWLKYGIYAVLFDILITLITYVFRPDGESILGIITGLLLAPGILVLISSGQFQLYFWGKTAPLLYQIKSGLIFNVANIIAYFIIGAIIGLIISKIKSKK